MGTMLRSKVTLLFMTFGALLAFAGVAYASSVDTAVVDVSVPTNSVSLQPGDSAPINFTLTVTGKQDGTATFEINRNWTLSGTTFTGSNPQTFTVGPRAAGDPADVFTTTGTITAANDATVGGPYTLAAGVFDITNTNTTGAKLSAGSSSNYDVTVVQPTPTDNTPPVITPNVSGTLGTNDWYISDVTVSWSVVDNESAIRNKTGCGSTTISSDTAGTTLTCEATSAGGTSSNSVTIKRDATKPTISGSATPAPNANGWNNSDVDVSYSCDDNLSGVASCGPDETLGEGANQSSTGTAVDNAGNSDTATVSNIDIDKTAPVVTVTGVSNGATYTLGSVPAAGCNTTDALSGVQTQATLEPLSGGPVGSVTATCSGAADNADNPGSASVTYNVNYNWTGFFSPVDNLPTLNVVKGGSSVPLKFSLSGNQGMGILAAGYPKSSVIPCDSTAVLDALETVATAGSSGLNFDSTTNQYNYIWKTEKSWTSGCRQVEVKLIDGTSHRANFKFTK